MCAVIGDFHTLGRSVLTSYSQRRASRVRYRPLERRCSYVFENKGPPLFEGRACNTFQRWNLTKGRVVWPIFAILPRLRPEMLQTFVFRQGDARTRCVLQPRAHRRPE